MSVENVEYIRFSEGHRRPFVVFYAELVGDEPVIVFVSRHNEPFRFHVARLNEDMEPQVVQSYTHRSRAIARAAAIVLAHVAPRELAWAPVGIAAEAPLGDEFPHGEGDGSMED